jgi:hypothetical protein
LGNSGASGRSRADRVLASRVYDAMLSGEIRDLHGNALTGVTQWSFLTAPDMTPPSVTTTSPMPGEVGVGVDAIVIVAFTEPVSNLSSSSFLFASPTGPVVGTIGYVSQMAVSFTPSLQLAPNTTYQATLTSAITDVGGNPLAGAPVTWAFTTGADTVAPFAGSFNPLEDDTDVPLTTTVIAHFSEPVVGVSATSLVLDHGGTVVPATVTYLASTRSARLLPDAPLLPNTIYRVTLGAAITDTSGNALAGAPVSWMFTTVP